LKLGIFTPVFGNLSVDQMLAEVGKYEKVSAIELGTGGWPGATHVDVEGLLPILQLRHGGSSGDIDLRHHWLARPFEDGGHLGC